MDVLFYLSNKNNKLCVFPVIFIKGFYGSHLVFIKFSSAILPLAEPETVIQVMLRCLGHLFSPISKLSVRECHNACQEKGITPVEGEASFNLTGDLP